MTLAQAQAAPLHVGTRASPLALVQTRAFIRLVADIGAAEKQADIGAAEKQADIGAAEKHGDGAFPALQEHLIRTTGDRVQDVRLAEIGGKGLFAKEIHEAMLDRRIDLAVHSLKDLETTMPDGIVLACTLKREDPRDALILGPACTAPDAADPFACLPEGALIGTSSVRRQSQLLHHRPDMKITLLRGNVQTRLERTEHGDFAASLLAIAGMKRLGLEHRASLVLNPRHMVPSACQGIVGVTARAGDTAVLEWLARIEDAESRAVATAERAMLAVLDGSCRTPIGGYAVVLPSGNLHLTGLVAREDGSFLVRRSVEGAVADAAAIGAALGAELRAECPVDVFSA